MNRAPDYSSSKKQFDFYAYSGPNAGAWRVDGETFSVGQDFRTVERFKEYKDAGMTIYFPQTSARIDKETPNKDWESVKLIWDKAYQAGLNKIIAWDSRIMALSQKTESLIGEGKLFADEDQLVQYIRDCLALYNNHPAFYGVMLTDEPKYTQVVAYGQTYRAIKKAMPSCFVQYNLLPMFNYQPMVESFYPPIDGLVGTREAQAMARYKLYLEQFIDATGADYVMYDHYPMTVRGIRDCYLPCMQIAAQVSKEKKVNFYYVAGTFEMTVKGELENRRIDEKDARWLNNTMLAYGVKQIGYFTYFTKGDNRSDGETFVDGGSFITRHGEKTDIYYFMQKIMAENQAFAPVILNFDYQQGTVYKAMRPEEVETPQSHIALMTEYCKFEKLKKISCDKEFGLITELLDTQSGQYMYAAVNLVNPHVAVGKQTVEMTFDGEYTSALVYQNGKGVQVPLVENKLVFELTAGDAVYVLPY